MALQSLLQGGFWSINSAIMGPFYDIVLRHPICPLPKGRLYTSILHGATDTSEEGIPGALGMQSRSPFTTSFYAMPFVYRQKGVPIRAFSMALQSLLKGGSLCRAFLVRGVWRALTLKPDSGGVRHAIMELFDGSVLRYPICPPPKGCPHTSILHGATESSEGEIPGALGKQSWSPFMTSFYIIPSILGALGMRSRNPLTTAFYTIPSVHPQKDVSIRAFSMALQSLLKGGSLCRVFLVWGVWRALTLRPDSGGVRHAIAKPLWDRVLHHPGCTLPKGRLPMIIFHRAIESSERWGS
ncbi:hypothetical protein B9Z19DRAFT_728248 [Tuber borchii]|uniref:Uncharacterized protein n=1 Tax=Tuber borchii TaxID=42251 RepID=A0A2T6Z9S5_TUBBO|nr:hypothetical protein B9Z19DRAFT_728248 [Tuber borchii]